MEVNPQPVDVFADRNITVQAVPLLRRPRRPLSPAALQSHVELVRHKIALVEAMFHGRFPAAFATGQAFPAATDPTTTNNTYNSNDSTAMCTTTPTSPIAENMAKRTGTYRPNNRS